MSVQVQSQLGNPTSHRENVISSKFGHGTGMLALCKDIDNNVNRFGKKPIGPLALYVQLDDESAKDPTMAALLETVIGPKILRSFIVESHKDKKTLMGLMYKHFPREIPEIQIKPFAQGRYSVDEGRVPTSCGIKTILDHLVFQDDMVFNFILDRCKIERKLVTTDAIAQERIKVRQNVPKNAILAVTNEFNKYVPATLGNYGSYFIKHEKHARNLLIPVHRQANHLQEQQTLLDAEIRELVKLAINI